MAGGVCCLEVFFFRLVLEVDFEDERPRVRLLRVLVLLPRVDVPLLLLEVERLPLDLDDFEREPGFVAT
jgi:hypothetical protein